LIEEKQQQQQHHEEEDEEQKDMDGGWGWVVVLGIGIIPAFPINFQMFIVMTVKGTVPRKSV
jgi:hypothetical protein